ncbi:serine/threonine kinase [Schistosoma mansoni]|uniref:serine/threonine kinase n=1 Tax=Schistosoma mansoni TaxID=6183 RepID=UPI00022DC8DC|nr:serine/threonine kinase [Schistosoma mansoni]|eukprot:XP_018647726.1 serine/threonine kinase [Schistosoma mansoni]
MNHNNYYIMLNNRKNPNANNENILNLKMNHNISILSMDKSKNSNYSMKFFNDSFKQTQIQHSWIDNTKCQINSNGKYKIIRTIGQGNFAKVKLAIHLLTGREVAIKMIDKIKMYKTCRDKLTREVRVTKSINHPNIVQLYEVIETGRYVYLVMEYAKNGEMFEYLLKHNRMSESDARRKFRQILSAVQYCHRKNIVHRDLKELHRRITQCDYRIPYFMSTKCELIIKRMLEIDPIKRSCLEELMEDPWINIGYEHDPLRPYIEPRENYNDPIRIALMNKLGFSNEELRVTFDKRLFNNIRATYLLLADTETQQRIGKHLISIGHMLSSSNINPDIEGKSSHKSVGRKLSIKNEPKSEPIQRQTTPVIISTSCDKQNTNLYKQNHLKRHFIIDRAQTAIPDSLESRLKRNLIIITDKTSNWDNLPYDHTGRATVPIVIYQHDSQYFHDDHHNSNYTHYQNTKYQRNGTVTIQPTFTDSQYKSQEEQLENITSNNDKYGTDKESDLKLVVFHNERKNIPYRSPLPKSSSSNNKLPIRNGYNNDENIIHLKGPQIELNRLKKNSSFSKKESETFTITKKDNLPERKFPQTNGNMYKEIHEENNNNQFIKEQKRSFLPSFSITKEKGQNPKEILDKVYIYTPNAKLVKCDTSVGKRFVKSQDCQSNLNCYESENTITITSNNINNQVVKKSYIDHVHLSPYRIICSQRVHCNYQSQNKYNNSQYPKVSSQFDHDKLYKNSHNCDKISSLLKWEMEVVQLPRFHTYGIRFKGIDGDLRHLRSIEKSLTGQLVQTMNSIK